MIILYDLLQMSRASLNKLLSVLVHEGIPLEYIMLVLINNCFKLVKGVMQSLPSPSGAQQPIWLVPSLARQPITARFLIPLLNGRVLNLFWSNTEDLMASYLESCKNSLLRIIFCLAGSVYQFSNNPNLNLTLNTFPTAVSRSF